MIKIERGTGQKSLLTINGKVMDGEYQILEGKPRGGRYEALDAPASEHPLIFTVDLDIFQRLSQIPTSDLAAVARAVAMWPEVVRPALTPLKIGSFGASVHVLFPGPDPFVTWHFPDLPSPDHPLVSIQLTLTCDLDNWKQLWSPAEYMDAFIRIAKQEEASKPWESKPEIEEAEKPREVSIEFVARIDDRPLADFVQPALLAAKKWEEAATASLAANLRSEAVVAQFHFPPEVAVPCEQYLMYFVQFLRDLGVEAKADLQHDAGNVLFAVTPENKAVALDKIHEALAVYLQLPTNPGMGGGMIGVGDIQGQQLMANVQHLQGQLMLANAVLQAKDATIQAQQMTITQQQRALGGEVLYDSLQRIEGGQSKKEEKDKEELLGGAVALTKYEGKGYEVNIPKIYRYFRDLFAEK